jgi:hypothetical protein
MCLFVLPCGVLWASGTCGSVLGGRWFFHGQSLFLRLASLSILDASLRSLHAVGGFGRWLLSFPPVAGRWLCQSPASLLHIHQVEGIYQVNFPCRGRYSPVTQPVTLEENGDGGGVDGSKTVSSGRCSSGSGAVWVFCLAPGTSWASLGLLSEEGFFLWGALGLSLAPPSGLGAAGPCGGPWAVSVLSLSCPDPGFHLVPLILGRTQISFDFHLRGVSFCRRPVGPSASLR